MGFLTENNAKRKKTLPVRGKSLSLPIYFPSISSVKTGLSPFTYFKLLKALKHSHFLISAYDIDKSFEKESFINQLKENLANDGPIILMDSGNYESWWMRDKEWNIDSFNKILSHDISDLAFCYDNQLPPENSTENAIKVVQSTETSQRVTKATSIIPIVHCKKEKLIESILELNKRSNFSTISIPERILGDGLLERIITITNLRRELNKLDNYTYLHLLGTGNPLSLLLLSLAGADSFDGLEWCQTVANPQTALLYHFQQRELVADDCHFCKTDIDYTFASLGHNLLFYKSWMSQIQDAISNNNSELILKKFLSAELNSKLELLWK